VTTDQWKRKVGSHSNDDPIVTGCVHSLHLCTNRNYFREQYFELKLLLFVKTRKNTNDMT